MNDKVKAHMALVVHYAQQYHNHMTMPQTAISPAFDASRAAVEKSAIALQAEQAEPLPNPGSPEASAMIDSMLAYYHWPANPKNAARAGYEAARRMLIAARPSEPPKAPVEPVAVPSVGDIWRDSTGTHQITAVDRGVITTAPVGEPPKRLSEADIEGCIDKARHAFNNRRQGPCGQQITTYDDWGHWFARAIESEVLRRGGGV